MVIIMICLFVSGEPLELTIIFHTEEQNAKSAGKSDKMGHSKKAMSIPYDLNAIYVLTEDARNIW